MFSITHTIYAWKSLYDKPSNTLIHGNPNGKSKWIVFHLPKPSFIFFFSYFESMNELKEGRRMSWRFLSFLSSFLPSSFPFFVFFLTVEKGMKSGARATQKSKVLQTNLNPTPREKLDAHAFTLASLFSICRIHIRARWNNRQPFFLSKRSSSRLFLRAELAARTKESMKGDGRV